MIGPGGVLVIDTKRYRGRLRLDSYGRLWHGRHLLVATLRKLRWAADQADEVLGVADVQVVAIMAVHGTNIPWGQLTADGVMIAPAQRVPDLLQALPAIPDPERSPLSLLLHYGAYRGRLRDVRAGAHRGAYCLGCCWSLMALFVVVGVMNLAAMVVLAAVVLAEKLWVHGEVLARVVGIAALALAVAVIWVPALAPGLPGTSQMMDMAGS